MSPIKPSIPDIPESERTSGIDALLELLKWQSGRIEQLEDETKKLKKETRKPKFESSKMDEKTEPEEKEVGNKKKKGSQRKKMEEIEIHEELIMEPGNLLEGVRFIRVSRYHRSRFDYWGT